jgi:hypothetical protein
MANTKPILSHGLPRPVIQSGSRCCPFHPFVSMHERYGMVAPRKRLPNAPARPTERHAMRVHRRRQLGNRPGQPCIPSDYLFAFFVAECI